MCGFAHSVRANHHQSTSKSRLAGGTVAATVSNVVQAFRKNLRPDPTLDNSGAKSIIIANQIKGYKNEDPSTKHQACLPLLVWKNIYNDHSNSLNTAMGQLLTGALFFAMRSCEYSSTPKQEEKKTKLLRLRNLRFFSRDKKGFMHTIPHSSSPKILSAAECISITFEDQKNGEKNACITQHRASRHKDLCPVRAWAKLVCRIMSYPNTTVNTTVNTIYTKGGLKQIGSNQTRSFIKSHVKSLGQDRLGIDAKQVGTHSLRSSCAMLLYLTNVRTSTIMLLGRWKSDAFLLYLRRQVKEFTQQVTHQMGAQPDLFFTIPKEDPQSLPPHEKSDRDDPRTTHPDSLTSSLHFNGLTNNNGTTNTNPLHPPALHVWG